ncbi:RimJ/RimL family protein N-acetyltransferase [Chitinophaga polysaccharea]|uniref:RimJ/RimL family protein N-acetyltransferase n=1 Tax=Chitinophaga polysaccharea TaxID=1293035 RepID=A0A561PLV6_9BACT|nr:GNAT family protein [Chitinophaga polysaccharea]TWF39091.1 RimJ/RimL family protein N-acetyltransferase [Chitinophaga polysaccharea]
MNFEPVLENKRVLLQPLQASHLDALWKIASDASLWAIQLYTIDSKEDLEKYIQIALTDRATGVSIPFVIIDKQDNRIVGSTRYMGLSLPNKRTEIGATWIAPSLHGSGLNKAMKYAMLRYAFEELELNRVEFKTDELNTQSRNAILSLGCTQEGIFRRHMITSTGRIRNTVYFSMLREEWPEAKQRVFGKYDF